MDLYVWAKKLFGRLSIQACKQSLCHTLESQLSLLRYIEHPIRLRTVYSYLTVLVNSDCTGLFLCGGVSHMDGQQH